MLQYEILQPWKPIIKMSNISCKEVSQLGFPISMDQLTSSISRIRLPGGMVGKVCTVLIVTILAIILLVSWTKNLIFTYFALASIVLIVFVFLWRLINFANANPQAALMEGAELLLHEQIIMASKDQPHLHVVPGSQQVPEKYKFSPEEEKNLEIPDAESVHQTNIASNDINDGVSNG